MSQPIKPDKDWDKFEEEIEKEEERSFLKIGYFLGRYTNISIRFKQKGDKVILETEQGLDLSALFEDALEAWRDRKK